MLRTQADLLHHRLGDFSRRSVALRLVLISERLAELSLDFLAWVQRRERVLEHHLHVVAQMLALRLVGAGHVLPVDFQASRTMGSSIMVRARRGWICRSRIRRPPRASCRLPVRTTRRSARVTVRMALEQATRRLRSDGSGRGRSSTYGAPLRHLLVQRVEAARERCWASSGRRRRTLRRGSVAHIRAARRSRQPCGRS